MVFSFLPTVFPRFSPFFSLLFPDPILLSPSCQLIIAKGGDGEKKSRQRRFKKADPGWILHVSERGEVLFLVRRLNWARECTQRKKIRRAAFWIVPWSFLSVTARAPLKKPRAKGAENQMARYARPIFSSFLKSWTVPSYFTAPFSRIYRRSLRSRENLVFCSQRRIVIPS